jgi:uncharacterized 2Fe-2S/4Fe-4S cluster protein (DUF4445 family)
MNRAGAAIDIGTTTVQAQLINLETAECLGTFFSLNDQRCFGADVMSRIGAAKKGKTRELFNVINNQVEGILRHFKCEWKLDKIEKCVVSANTVMLHLFCGIDPSTMGIAPYRPEFLEEKHFSGKDLSLSAEQIILLPGISAFVGADITAGLAFTGIMDKGEDGLFVDAGTNGEIAVWNESVKKLFCCSTAAGSCFEEVEISCGLNAADFIDVIAEMKHKQIIDETGALADEYGKNGYPAKNGKVITQKDIRLYQLTKSAIYSGIKLLCKTAALDIAKIGGAYIAGGLGDFINLENAAETGLIPNLIIGKTTVCGNTSLKGAVKCLTDPDFLPHCRRITAAAETVELANDKYFSAAFTHNMFFR